MRQHLALCVVCWRPQARVSALERKLLNNSDMARLKDDLAQSQANEEALREAVKSHELEVQRLRETHRLREQDLEKQVRPALSLDAVCGPNHSTRVNAHT